MPEVAENLAGIRARMLAACRTCGRSPDEVRLLAVSKTFPASAIREAWEAGQRDFGESRQQEAAAKIPELPQEARWHFIGRLQRNKVRKVLADFGCVQSVDSLKLAEAIDRIAGEIGVRPEILLEVNLAGEENKGGFSPGGLREAMSGLTVLGNVKITGLMAIPPDGDGARAWFAKTRELRDELERRSGLKLPELSMGMSSDFEIAIEEGSTMIRVGSAIFGGRNSPT